jgi:cystathionine gamma-synthase
MEFDTLAIHAGQDAEALTGAVVPPIYQVSTYRQDGVARPRGGWEYSRSGNPTRAALEACLAALEGGTRGFAFASGLAASDTLVRAACRPGDHVVIPADAYGGTYRLFAGVLQRWGVEYTPVDMADVAALQAALRQPTRMVWCETPTNPLLGIADITVVADAAHAAGALLVVDNTFASPYLQRPLALGADAVVHSTTKYLGGHSDVVGGAVVVGAVADLADSIGYHQNAMGAVAGPFDAWLVLRGVRTLGARMRAHCAGARAVIAAVSNHPAIAAVLWPGLPGHSGYPIASRQMRDFGGMVSLRLRGGEGAAVEVCERTTLWTLAESLGGVESLIEHPARMTHASAAGSALEVPGDLVRLSVGLEHPDDLIEDLVAALDSVV